MQNDIQTPEEFLFYRTVVRHFADTAVFLLDQTLHFLLVDGQALNDIFQIAEPLIGEHIHDVWPSHLLINIESKLQAVLLGKVQSWYLQTPNRSLFLQAIPVEDSPASVLIIVRDITQERQHVEQLRSDAERYRAIVEENNELMCRFTVDGVLTFVNGALSRSSHQQPEDLISTSFFRLCLERDVPEIRQTINNLSPDVPNAVMEVRMRSMGGTQRWVRWSFHAITDAGGNIAEIQSVGYDVTDKVRMRVAEKKQHNLTEALRNIAAVLNSTLNLNEVLEHIIDIIDLVVRHDAVNVMFVEDGYATVVRGKGYSELNIKGVLSLRLRIRRVNHLRYMMETGRETVISNVQQHSAPCLDVPELCWVESYVGAPIISEGKVIGFLNLESSTPDFFAPEHARLVRAFADHAATAIRNAQLFEQAKHVAVIEEKQRLARELHDAVNQTLFSANMIADALPYMFESQPESVPEQLQLLRQQTQLAMAELRAMLFELRPQAIDDNDLQTLLLQLVQAFTNRTQMDIALNITGDAIHELSLDVKIVFYRVAQEAINNAIQHANATQATISLEATPDELILTITDNGRGFEHHGSNAGHMGLRIMQERADAIRAKLTINSEFGEGTTIILTWGEADLQNEITN